MIPKLDINQEYRRLTDRVTKLESALRFYADENTWNICGEWEMDKGKKAREALNE